MLRLNSALVCREKKKSNIQIQPMLRLNPVAIAVLLELLTDSNTTNVKVKHF